MIGQARLKPELARFWPSRGPQWDGLGLAGGAPVIVEAKAHIAEIFSSPSHASAASAAQISNAFAEVQASLGIFPTLDWKTRFYQLANRIAHLWWFHQQGVEAHLLLVSFIGDKDMNCPSSPSTWESAFRSANDALGLPSEHALSKFIHHVYPDVTLLV
ncbi:MAG: hypothetical protein R3D34_19790 [Nitratireductor sp.]